MEQHLAEILATPSRRSVDLMMLGTPTSSAWNIAGFGPSTQIDTDYGPRPAQTLRVGDLVRLRSGRFGPIVRIETLQVDEADVDDISAAKPVLIGRARLGFDFPIRPVLLAPGQKLSDRQRLPETYRTAGDLLRAGFAQRHPESLLRYVVFSFAAAEDVCAGGVWLRVEPADLVGNENQGAN